MIVRKGSRAYFTHATPDRDQGRRTISDRPISEYLSGSSKHAGLVARRPRDLPLSKMREQPMVSR